jgi:hypothetical protein
MPMRHTLLALLTAAIWVSVYGWFFHREIRHWWTGRAARREAKARRRAEAIAAYARWARTVGVPPPSAEPPPAPPALPSPPVPAEPPRSGVVVPFPRTRSTRR